MTDRIHIRGLLVRAIIGVAGDEREKEQDVVLDVTLHVDARAAAASDDLADAVDYKTIKNDIVARVRSSRFHLLEALCDSVARLCLASDGVHAVDVTVDKPGALRFAKSVAVEMHREAT